MRSFPAPIAAQFDRDTPIISYYMKLTRSDGVEYRLANYDVNWHGLAGAATLGFHFEDPIVWQGSSTQTCRIVIPRSLTLNGLGDDIGDQALANVLRNGTVDLWLRGGLDAELVTALAADQLKPWYSGRIIGCATGPDVVVISCSTEYQMLGMTPQIRITPPTFNFLPAVGATTPYSGGVLQLGNEGK